MTPALQAVVAKAEAAFLRAYVAAGGEARWLHDLPLTAGIQAAIESTRIERSGGVVVDEAMVEAASAAYNKAAMRSGTSFIEALRYAIDAALQSAQPAQGPTFSLEAPTGQPVHVWTDADREGVRSAMQVIVDREQAQPQGEVVAPSFRGYAKLGIGAYLVNSTEAGTEPELIISVATEAELEALRAGGCRVPGDTFNNPEGTVLLPEAMAVRIGFANVAGLEVLEATLRDLRETHFHDTRPQVAQGWKLVPVEPTPEILAAAAIAVWPMPTQADIALAHHAALIVLMQMDAAPGSTVETIAAGISTMAPAYRAMLAAAPSPTKETK